MALRNVALVIADISGYTEFIRNNNATLEHASEVIGQLLELVAKHASHPLRLNKLEGDATFLFADLGADERAGARDVARQVLDLFPLFRRKIIQIASDRKACPCDACQSVTKLRLKVVMHKGLVAVRTILGLEELAGEDVILVHRLLKNSIASREYIAMTRAFHDLSGSPAGMRDESSNEYLDGFGAVGLHVFFPEQKSSTIVPPGVVPA